jgi:hypothetical protein
MKRDDLGEAKRRLPLSGLMVQLGYADRAKKSARCPFHEDSSSSFSFFTGEDGEERWKCFAGCGDGDAIDFLAKFRSLTNSDACREYLRLAGMGPAAPSPASNSPTPIDWKTCVAALAPDPRERLAGWRGYSPGFVDWLHSQELIGLFEGEHIAFPVYDAKGDVIGCHYRLKVDGSWRYHPTGTHTTPLIIGDIATARIVPVFESQWDLLAFLDAVHWHIQPTESTAVIATRGAANGRLMGGLCAQDAVVYAFVQNDAAGEKWLAAVASNCSRKTFQVVTPSPHKDLNDWTRAGAVAADIQRAIVDSRPVASSAAVELRAAPAAHVSTRSVILPEDDAAEDTPAPFPIECMPPDMASMIRATSLTLGVPDSLPGLMALALTSACIGKGLLLAWRPGKASTPANLFVLLSAESGTGKSEGYKMIADPFLVFERAMQDQWRNEVMPQLQADLRYHEGQLKKLDRKLAKDSTTQVEAEHCRSEQK